MNIFEPSIRIVQWFFGALIALSLTHLFRDGHNNFHGNIWPVFILTALLFTRYLIGSANHMWYEYIKHTTSPNDQPVIRHMKLFKDFAFLAFFGFLAVRTTDTATVESLLRWSMALLSVAVSWTFLDQPMTSMLSWRRIRNEKPTMRWRFWLRVNLVQLLCTLVVYCTWDCLGQVRLLWTRWSASLLALCIVYAFLLLWDFHEQCKLLESTEASSSLAMNPIIRKAPPSEQAGNAKDEAINE
jgi:hypothetical protein